MTIKLNGSLQTIHVHIEQGDVEKAQREVDQVLCDEYVRFGKPEKDAFNTLLDRLNDLKARNKFKRKPFDKDDFEYWIGDVIEGQTLEGETLRGMVSNMGYRQEDERQIYIIQDAKHSEGDEPIYVESQNRFEVLAEGSHLIYRPARVERRIKSRAKLKRHKENHKLPS